ncbi:MAG: hypothetical protein IJJ82_00430 [Clostridia bacterium]|nr:hypothetical protein [Clostridia bacterium]
MKKCIIILVVLLLMLGIATSVNAYSTSEFEIDIPDSFEQVELNKYADENGRGFNIVSKPFEAKVIDPYNQATLDMIVDTLYNNFDAVKRNIKTEMESTYGSELSDEEINEYVNSFKCNSIDVKEITKCTKNNYKCFHILAQYSMADYSYYCDQYIVVSGNKMYVLTLSSEDKDDFNSADFKKVLDSFTINNYKESQSSLGLIIGGIIRLGLVVGLVIAVVFRNKNKNKNVNLKINEYVNMEEKTEEEKNVNNNEKNIEESINTENNEKAELPMNWWKFLKYFRYPVGILGLFVSIVQSIEANVIAVGWLGWTAIILDSATLITSSVAYAMMLGKHKKWFNFLVLNLVVESVQMTLAIVLNTSLESNYINLNDYKEIVIYALMSWLLAGSLWIIPNYIYFKKRKAYFTKKEENNNIAI